MKYISFHFLYCIAFLQLFTAPIQGGGMDGYLSYGSSAPPAGYGYGVGFYSAVWPLMDQQLSDFQVGLPGCWVAPNNSDNTTEPLCPIGTVARDNWHPRGPTYASVFQTMEGGLGYWARNHFRSPAPKFSMNGTPDCYNNEIATPGWSFFYSNTALPDTLLGIAQISNRLLVPPDALPFQGNPTGQLCGYTWMNLPLTDAKPGPPPVGNQSWTLFLSTANFKGPVAYYLPETWAKISTHFPFDYGRGLDARPADISGGAMEWNTIPLFEATASGTTYGKTPLFKWPCDSTGKGILLTDYTYYSRSALYNSVLAWRQGGTASPGTFDTSTASRFVSTLSAGGFSLKQNDNPINFNKEFTMTTFGSRAWGMQWAKPTPPLASFSEYWKQSGTNRIPIPASEVPAATGLTNKSFNKASQGVPYTSPTIGSWAIPGFKSGPFKAYLADRSIATYYWYRFIDQPVFQQYKWTATEKANLQALVEKIHANWTMNKTYMPLPSIGTLASLDPGLIVTPPAGLEVGYVPIVTKQEYNPSPVPIAEYSPKSTFKNVLLQKQMGNTFVFNAHGNESYRIELRNLNGKVAKVYSITGPKEFRFTMDGAKSVYLLSVRSNNKWTEQKILVP